MQEKSEKELKRIQFYKELIKHKLDGIRDIIGDLKYRVYLGVVEECNDYNELREIAELDMHIEFVEYVKKHILDKLNEDEVSIDDLREYYYGESMENSEAEVVFSNIVEADDSFIALMAMALNNRFIHDEEIDEPEEIELDDSALEDEYEFDIYDYSEEPEQELEFDEESLYGDEEELEENSDDVEFDVESIYGDEEELEENSDDVGIDEESLYGDEIEEPEEVLEEPEEVEFELEEVDDELEINEDDFFVDSDELEEDEVDNTDVEIDDSDFFVDGDEDDEDAEDTLDEAEIDVDENEFFVDGDDEVDDFEEEDEGINEEDFFVDGDDDIEEDVEEPVDDEIDENDFFMDSEEDEEGIDVDTLFEDDDSSGELFIPSVAKKPQSQQSGSTQPKTADKPANTVFRDPKAQSVLDFMHKGLSGIIGPKKQNPNKGKPR